MYRSSAWPKPCCHRWNGCAVSYPTGFGPVRHVVCGVALSKGEVKGSTGKTNIDYGNLFVQKCCVFVSYLYKTKANKCEHLMDIVRHPMSYCPKYQDACREFGYFFVIVDRIDIQFRVLSLWAQSRRCLTLASSFRQWRSLDCFLL